MRAPWLLAALLLPAVPTAAQEGRFAGWEQILQAEWSFDPDERGTLGFSVRASSSVRAAFDEVEAEFRNGRPEQAARRLLGVLAEMPNQVLQVAGGKTPGAERWVGAGEWALFQLTTRVGANLRASLAPLEARAALVAATTWRDTAGLRRLSSRWEGLPEAAAAASTLARLLAEEGRGSAAAEAADRARQLGAPAGLSALAARVLPPPAASAPTPLLPSRLALVWAARLPLAELADGHRSSENPFLGPRDLMEAPFAPVRPVVADGVLYLADSLSVSAHELLSGRPLWHAEGPLERIEAEGDDLLFPFHVYSNAARPRAISPYQCAWPVVDEQRVLATVQVAEPWHDLDEFEGYPINYPLPRRRLVALDRRTGGLLWSQERPNLPEGEFCNRFDVHGPPVVVGGTVLAAGSVTEGAINGYLAAFDGDTGDLLWRTLLCTGQQDLTMFNRPFQEHVVSPPLVQQGVAYVCTNLGLVAAVDAWSGRIRWLAAYDVIPRDGARSVRPDTRRDVHWLNQPPFVEAGVLVVSPLDGRQALFLDPATGRAIFRLTTSAGRQTRFWRHQVLPTGLGHVVVVSADGTEAFSAADGEPVWSYRAFDESPLVPRTTVVTGAVNRVGDELVVPADDRLLVLSREDGTLRRVVEWPAVWDLSMQRVEVVGPVTVLVDGSNVFGAWADVPPAELELALGGVVASPGERRLLLAERALAEGHYADAVLGYRAALADPGLAAAGGEPRARSGLLEAALRQARVEDSPAAWEAALAAADPDERFTRGAEVLSALARLGALHELDRWLGELSAQDPRRTVAVDADGPVPVGVLWARVHLDLEPPARQVELLQELLWENPDARWEGLTVREEAGRRLESLLREHGRDLYAPFEAAARRELVAGRSLAEVGERYPAAQAVAEARLRTLEQRLQEGAFAEVLSASGPTADGARLDRLRETAARGLGEEPFAEWLAGRGQRQLPRLPTLPEDGSQVTTFDLGGRLDVDLLPTSGEPGPEWSGVVVGFVERLGEMFALDALSGRLLWAGRALPGFAVGRASGLRCHLAGDRLVVRGRDVLEGIGLVDGRSAWSHDLHELLALEPIAGLLVCLRRSADETLLVEGYGPHSGALAWRTALPAGEEEGTLHRAGASLVAATTGGDGGRRLYVLDPLRGAILATTKFERNLGVVAALDEPELLVLAGQSGGTATRLLGWSPEYGTRWDSPVAASFVGSSDVLPLGPGQLIVRTPATAPEHRRLLDRLLPVDALTGPHEAPLPLGEVRLVGRAGTAPSPLLVLKDPAVLERLLVVDGTTGALLFERTFDAPVKDVEVHPARNGLVLALSGRAPVAPSAWVLAGPAGEAGYRIDLTGGPFEARPVVRLVEGAIVVACGGRVHVVRSTR